MHSKVKIPTGFVVELDKLFLKFIWQCKGLRRAETVKEEKQRERTCLSDIQTYYNKTVIINTVRSWGKGQTYKPADEKRESRNGPIRTQTLDF